MSDSHLTMRGTGQDSGEVPRWPGEVQAMIIEAGHIAQTPTMVPAMNESDESSQPLQASIQRENARADEMSLGKCGMPQTQAETAGEAHMSTFAQIQPLAGELCRLLAGILRRALEGDDEGCLTTGGKST
jgi:hypothetical protein